MGDSRDYLIESNRVSSMMRACPSFRINWSMPTQLIEYQRMILQVTELAIAYSHGSFESYQRRHEILETADKTQEQKNDKPRLQTV